MFVGTTIPGWRFRCPVLVPPSLPVTADRLSPFLESPGPIRNPISPLLQLDLVAFCDAPTLSVIHFPSWPHVRETLASGRRRVR